MEARTRTRNRPATHNDEPPERIRERVNRGAQETVTKVVPTNSLETALKRATGVDFKIVDTDDLVFNDYNPNAMEQELFDSLAEQVKEEGGVTQTILVRPHPAKPGKWLVIDGEHRAKSAKVADVPQVLVAVVPYVDSKAKLKTLAMNNLRGQAIPIKLASLIVDLQKSYSQEEIARFTGIGMDKQLDVLKLLEVPDFSDMADDTVMISSDTVERPVQVSLLLMPDEKKNYDEAMVKAMGIAGADVTPLVGEEVKDYHKAIGDSMGLVGVKLRNIGLSMICRAFLDMPGDFKKRVAEKLKEKYKDRHEFKKNAKRDKGKKSKDPLEDDEE